MTPTPVTPARRLTADLAILAVTAVWGLTFVSVKNALADMGPYTFNALRFWIAALFLALFLGRNLFRLPVRTLAIGGGLGLLLAAGYIFQTLGLQYTTASNGGFITGLSVVLVPLLLPIWTRQSPNGYTLAASFLAATGLAFLSLQGTFALNYGDGLIIFCAISFALHIIGVGRYGTKLDIAQSVFMQILTTALLTSAIALFVEPLPQRADFTLPVINGLLITAIPATTLAFLVQNWVQRFTSPSRTALIFSTEPVFAAIAGMALLNETMTAWQGFGALLIMAGILLSEWKGAH